MKDCPKCGYSRRPADQAPAWQCPRCGIAYHKFKEQTAEVEDLRPRPAMRRTRSRSPLSIDTLQRIGLAITLAVLALKALAGGVSIINALLLFPFYILLITVLSGIWGDGVYVWNRSSMSFEGYDRENHPFMARFSFVFALATVGFFLFAFWKLPR